MAEVKNNEEESALHAKRKPNLNSVDKNEELKKQKLEISGKDSSFVEEKIKKDKEDEDNDDGVDEEDCEDDDEDEDDDDDDDDDDDEEEEEEDEGGEHSNGKAAVDRKGKGILRVDKGKGKLIEEDESDDDSSDGEGESDGDSDLSDDPLAEVDLDNILPSRTRRRVVNPGVNIAKDIGNDDDDSDDSDA